MRCRRRTRLAPLIAICALPVVPALPNDDADHAVRVAGRADRHGVRAEHLRQLVHHRRRRAVRNLRDVAVIAPHRVDIAVHGQRIASASPCRRRPVRP